MILSDLLINLKRHCSLVSFLFATHLLVHKILNKIYPMSNVSNVSKVSKAAR